MTMKSIKSHLSRHIEIEPLQGDFLRFRLHVLELEMEDGIIVGYSVRPYTREEPFVEYHDTPLLLRQRQDGSWMFFEA